MTTDANGFTFEFRRALVDEFEATAPDTSDERLADLAARFPVTTITKETTP